MKPTIGAYSGIPINNYRSRVADRQSRAETIGMNVESQFDLSPILREKKAYLAETYHVRSIGIFGSCRRGEEHEGSDVDILVEFSEVPGIFGLSGLSNISPNFSGGRWTSSK